MSYTNIVDGEMTVKVPSMQKTTTKNNPGAVAVRAQYRQDRPNSRVQTYVLLTTELARSAGFRAGARVSVLEGTGRDAGKVRIVADKNGSYKLGRTGSNRFSLRVRTNALLGKRTRTKATKVTSFTKGAITIAL